MKYSAYNSLIPINIQHSLLYNALSDKFLILKGDQKDKYHTYDTNEIQAEIGDSFRQRLIREGFLVETGTNETDVLRQKSALIDADESSYMLILNPTLDCNFKCWYCYENHISQSVMSAEILTALKQHITHVLDRKEIKNFSLSFFGGEPLLPFEENVLPIVDFTQTLCNKKGVKLHISFTTNGYLLTEKRLEQLKKYDLYAFQITLDGSREAHDKVRKTHSGEGSYDTILAHVHLLLAHHILVTLRINFTARNLDTCATIAEDLAYLTEKEKSYLTISLQHVWQDRKNDTDNQVRTLKKIFRNYGLRAEVPLPDLVREPCYADKRNECVINYNGDVFKCTARDFKPEKRYGHLQSDGTIAWEGDLHERHMHTAFANDTCLNCRIAPLCKGGCAQTRMDYEGKEGYCLYDHDEKAKDKVILDRFEELFMNK